MKFIKLFENEVPKTGPWEVLSVRRKDGIVFSIGDKYKDGNDETFTIDSFIVYGDLRDGQVQYLYMQKKVENVLYTA